MINELKIRVLQTLLFTYLSLSPILEDRVAANVYNKWPAVLVLRGCSSPYLVGNWRQSFWQIHPVISWLFAAFYLSRSFFGLCYWSTLQNEVTEKDRKLILSPVSQFNENEQRNYIRKKISLQLANSSKFTYIKYYSYSFIYISLVFWILSATGQSCPILSKWHEWKNTFHNLYEQTSCLNSTVGVVEWKMHLISLLGKATKLSSRTSGQVVSTRQTELSSGNASH